MSIHEHQSMSLLSEFGVPTPRGQVAYTGMEAFEVAKSLSVDKVIVKAQIIAGGRGKGHFSDGSLDFGGVQVVKSASEVREKSEMMIGKNLITKQTGKEGRPCNSVSSYNYFWLNRLGSCCGGN